MQYCLDALSENTNIEGEQVLHPHNYSEHCKQTVRGLKKKIDIMLKYNEQSEIFVVYIN